MNMHKTLNSICARTSFLLDLETCFIAKHSNKNFWTMIAGHGILVAPHAFSLSSNLNFTDRGINEVHGTCTLQFQQAFNTTLYRKNFLDSTQCQQYNRRKITKN